MTSAWSTTRIRKQREFREIFRKGRRLRGSRLTLIRLRRKDANRRLAIVITKKTGSAVVRNRWKRIVRDEFQAQNKKNSISEDILVWVHRETRGKPRKQDREELAGFFRRNASA